MITPEVEMIFFLILGFLPIAFMIIILIALISERRTE